jgi:hypothetical protein
MNRLQSEWQRLYAPGNAPDDGLIDADGRVRAAVIELARPASWDTLSAVWRGVQADLELPAPAIAVSGTEGLQLWFSFATPVPTTLAADFVARLRNRYLADVAAKRLRLMPHAPSAPADIAELQPLHALRVPLEQAAAGQWSAFVAPDLAPVFEDTPWLDIPPSLDGQADLLARLKPMPVAAFEAAMAALQPAAPAPRASEAAPHGDAPPAAANARAFLRQVMNDPGVPMALRIEAAKALLPFDDA